MIKNKKYRLGVGIMMFNVDKNIFVGQRNDNIIHAAHVAHASNHDEIFQMPQGGIDDGEEPVVTMHRELMEEIGVDNIRVVYQSKYWYKYNFPHYMLSNALYSGCFGQKQKWFLVQFLGKDSDININTEHPEFNKWKWSNINDLPKEVVNFKQEMYKQIVNEFSSVLKEFIFNKK